jgi:hypothetical protein
MSLSRQTTLAGDLAASIHGRFSNFEIDPEIQDVYKDQNNPEDGGGTEGLEIEGEVDSDGEEKGPAAASSSPGSASAHAGPVSPVPMRRADSIKVRFAKRGSKIAQKARQARKTTFAFIQNARGKMEGGSLDSTEVEGVGEYELGELPFETVSPVVGTSYGGASDGDDGDAGASRGVRFAGVTFADADGGEEGDGGGADAGARARSGTTSSSHRTGTFGASMWSSNPLLQQRNDVEGLDFQTGMQTGTEAAQRQAQKQSHIANENMHL